MRQSARRGSGGEHAAGPLLQLDARWGLAIAGLWAGGFGDSRSKSGGALDPAAAVVEGCPAGGR